MINWKRELREGVPIAGLMLAAAGAVVLSQRMGWVDGDAGLRVSMAITGLACVYYANRAPKERPTRSPRAQAVNRVAGWLFVVAGLLNAAIWAFAPMDIAPMASMVPLVLAIVSVVTYCLLSRRTERPSA